MDIAPALLNRIIDEARIACESDFEQLRQSVLSKLGALFKVRAPEGLADVEAYAAASIVGFATANAIMAGMTMADVQGVMNTLSMMIVATAPSDGVQH